MNELQRQKYLSALGVETYIPRWHLPFAPVSIQCKLPESSSLAASAQPLLVSEFPIEYPKDEVKRESSPIRAQEPTKVSHIIADVLDVKAPERKSPINANTILNLLNDKPVVVEPFSLSIWRPIDGLMIIDSRNSKLALPTDKLLGNIVNHFCANQKIRLDEEVLRWPMIENSFAKRTISDAKTELQTWLSVEHEIRPIKHLWLMGNNAVAYFVSENFTYTESIFDMVNIAGISIQAIVLPELNHILTNPLQKQKLLSAIRRYHV